LTTAAGITRVLAQLRDAGRTSACVRCPICDGGKRQRPTLSVDLRDGVWLYLCHRATCAAKGAVPDKGGSLPERPAFVPRPLNVELRFPQGDDPILPRLRASLGDATGRYVTTLGPRVFVADPSTLAWRIRGFDGRHKGWITRDADKNIKTWRSENEPFYAVFRSYRPELAGPLVLVEDCLSASLLAWDGIDAVALNGTNLSSEAAREIVAWSGDHNVKIVVALDPDALKLAHLAQRRLTSLGARDAFVYPLAQDVKDMTPVVRDALVKNLRALQDV
jgi:hypothetical protein